MIFEQKYRVSIEDVGLNDKVTSKALLSYLEDIACLHSNSVGFGPLNAKDSGFVWILLNWKVEIIKRVTYGEKILVRTWSRKYDKISAYRDFEMRDENDELIARATSKWFLMDFNTRRPARITEEQIARYESEPNRKVFEDEIKKLIEPKEFESEMEYTVARRDIDMNEHMHNLNYLDLAYEVLPEEVYRNEKLNNISIEYKKELKCGDRVKCVYSKIEEQHVVTIKMDDKINAIVVLK